MKELKKITTLGIVFGMTCLTAAGCGKMTAEKVNEKMKEASAGQQMTYAEIDYEMEATYDISIMGTDMSMPINMDLELNQSANAEPFEGYAEGHITAELMGQMVDSDIKVHTVIEDDNIITYSYTGMTDSWNRADTGVSSADYEEYMVKIPELDFTPEEITLEEETATVNGTEVYVLHMNFSGEDIKYILSEAGALGGMLEIPEDSMSAITIPSITYIDTKTFLPVQIDMTIEGMDQCINQMMTEELEAAGTSAEDASVSIEVSKCQMIMKNFGYGVQELPEVPQEVFDELAFGEALAMAGDTLADGRYLLKYGNSAAAMSDFDQFTLNTLADGTVEFYSNDGMKVVSISTMPASTAQQAISESLAQVESLASSMGGSAEGLLEPEKVSTRFGDIEASGMGTNGVTMYYAAIPLDGMDLLVVAMDLTGQWQEPAEILIPITDAISEVTLEDLQQGDNNV